MRTLVVEISGRRPGDSRQRTTERMSIDYDKCIVSNDAKGYETDWPIVMVPDEYREWYEKKMRLAEGGAWLAPMNRSYAIQYAREKGYDRLVQLDDNIEVLAVQYLLDKNSTVERLYRKNVSYGNFGDMPNDFIKMMNVVLDETNAGIAGMSLCGAAMPGKVFLMERYCYSFFTMDLKRIPDAYHGDFEDDIEFRLRMAQHGVPMVQIGPLAYAKRPQSQKGGKSEDTTGNRIEYIEAGVRRGEHMRLLYGDMYRAGMSDKTKCLNWKTGGKAIFRHRLGAFKVGAVVRDMGRINSEMSRILKKYARDWPEKVEVIECEA